MLLYIPLEKLGIDKEEILATSTENIYYLSESIQQVNVTDRHLIVDTLEHRKVRKKIKHYFAQLRPQRKLKAKILEDNTTLIPSYHRSFISASDGALLTGESTFLENAIDQLICRIAKKYQAQFRQYPSFISEKSLQISGYAKHFPQYLYRVSEVPHDYETLNQYRSYSNNNQATSDFFKPSTSFLQPCICYHVYQEHSNLETQQSSILYTAKGRCYRHEHQHRLSPTRLQEFTMREIVFIGQDEEVRQLRMRLLSEVWDLFEDLGLRGYLTTSNDPFFLHQDQDKKLYQIAGNTKYEVIFSPNEEIHVSVASGNHCGTMLCDAFEINNKEKPLYSGCMAFGIDRWVQAFLYQHGTNPSKWPLVVRELLS